MKTLTEIEALDIASLSNAARIKLRHELQDAFYYTRTSEVDSEGRSVKQRIAEQLTRFMDFSMGPRGPRGS